METPKQNEPIEDKKTTAAPKPAAKPAAKKAGKLPSKPISFSNHPQAKGGAQAKTSVNKSKKGGVNLMKKLSGM